MRGVESASEASAHGLFGGPLFARIDRAAGVASGSRRRVGPESWLVLKRQAPIEVLLFKVRLFEHLG